MQIFWRLDDHEGSGVSPGNSIGFGRDTNQRLLAMKFGKPCGQFMVDKNEILDEGLALT